MSDRDLERDEAAYQAAFVEIGDALHTPEAQRALWRHAAGLLMREDIREMLAALGRWGEKESVR